MISQVLFWTTVHDNVCGFQTSAIEPPLSTPDRIWHGGDPRKKLFDFVIEPMKPAKPSRHINSVEAKFPSCQRFFDVLLLSIGRTLSEDVIDQRDITGSWY